MTTATYVLIAIGVFGTFSVDQAREFGETAIAEAARPTLGDAGFTLMAVAALIATAGATNGTLFGSASLTDSLAEIGQFPPLLGRQSRLGKHGGLLVTATLALVLAKLRRPSRDRLGRKCLLARRLPARRARRLSAEIEHGCLRRNRSGRNRGDRDRARIFAVDTLRNAPETLTAIGAMTLLAVVLGPRLETGERPSGRAGCDTRDGLNSAALVRLGHSSQVELMLKWMP